jgi:periplasmic protein CpxP/Spy
MKTKISLLLSFILMATISSFAQAPQRRTVEERVKLVMEKLSALNLDQSQAQKTDSVFVDYYKAQEKMREDARASGERPDRSVFEKMTNDRNEKLKAIFTADQFTKYKNEVEATLRPQRQRSQGN